MGSLTPAMSLDYARGVEERAGARARLRVSPTATEVAMAHLGGSASSEIEAPLEGVWAVVGDVLTAPEWQGGLDPMSALERDAHGRAPRVETESDIKARRVKARERLSYAAPTRLS